MTRTVKAEGNDLQAVLGTALGDLLGCPVDEVSVKVEAPGIDDLAGEVGLTLSITPGPEPAPAPVEAAADAADRAETTDVTVEDRSDGESDVAEVDLDEEADAAADFLEGLLDAMDLPGDLRIKIHDDHAEIEVVEIGNGALIGRRGQTLEAIQELVRCSLQRQFQRRARVKIDAEGYRSRRLEKLLEKTEEAIDEVLDTGEAVRLEPMDVFERKAVHHLVAEYDGIESRSQGREPARRVVIEPA